MEQKKSNPCKHCIDYCIVSASCFWLKSAQLCSAAGRWKYHSGPGGLYCQQQHPAAGFTGLSAVLRQSLGWGWDNFIREADTGNGIKFPKWVRGYVTYLLPLIVLYIFVQGYIVKFF